MIKSTRIKLAVWIMVVTALVAVFFSSLIYFGISKTFERSFVRAEQHLEALENFNGLPPMPNRLRQPFEPSPRRVQFFKAEYDEARQYIALVLITVNGVILVLAGSIGYFLAGKALSPLEHAINEQKRFVSDASHELRTPLTALKTALEVNISDKQVHAYEKTLMKENLEDVSALTLLINRLLQLSRSESQKELGLTLIDPTSNIDKVVKTLTPLAKAKDLTLTISTSSNHQKIFLDPDLFSELITILLDNAIKYSDPKSLVNLTSTMTKKELTLTVHNQGIGIDRQDLHKIFDRFYRADKSRNKSKVEGFGLGLSLAKHIVQIHQGSISAQSTPQAGTTFTVILPTSLR